MIVSESTGVSYPAISANKLLDLQIPIPPPKEQVAIAAYLDQKTAIIDELIAQAERKIQLLQELRAATINQAVTKGLDPKARMKDSGVEWIGEIPSHWQIKRMKYVVSCNDEVLGENTDPDKVINYVEIGDVMHGQGIISFTALRFAEAPSRARRIARTNDLAISTVRTYLKAIAKVNNEHDSFIFSTGFAILRGRKIHPKFLAFCMHCEGIIDLIVSESTGVSYPAISANKLLDFFIPIPPTQEQISITDQIDKSVAEFDKLTDIQKENITLLKEYRSSLISEAVTGKICVLEQDEIPAP